MSNNSEFNEDELQAPEWLNAQFLAKVLREHEKQPDLQITDVRISPASMKGDHYASVMFRTTVDYTVGSVKTTKPLIVKTMPETEGHKKEMLESSNIFATEIRMYSEILPKFEAILRGVGDDTVLKTPCLFHSEHPRNILIFEDLVPQGYDVIRDRDPTIPELHCALAKLAKWHAISFKLLKENPDQFKECQHGLMDMPKLMEDPFMNSGFDVFIDMLGKVPELTKYKPHFEKQRHTYMDTLKSILAEYRVNRQSDVYYVLSHGDFHLRNMMFKTNKETGQFEDCMLLDFQIANICPMTVDVIYAVYMLMSPDHRHSMRDQLISYYFSVLTETLQKIGYKAEMPKLADFQQQLFRHRGYDLFLITTFLPMMFAMKAGRFSPAEVLQTEEKRRNCFFVAEYLEDLKRMLPRLLSQGYLD